MNASVLSTGGRTAPAIRDASQAHDALMTKHRAAMANLSPVVLRAKNRGSAISNAQRGITLALRSRGGRVDPRLFVADLFQAQTLKNFARFGVPGFVFMIALGIFILPIHFAIKRDDKAPPGLGIISLIEYALAFIASEQEINKRIQHQKNHGIEWITIDYALVQSYIKPMDRFVARAWMFFGASLWLAIFLSVILLAPISQRFS